MKILIAVILTLIGGYLGAVLGHDLMNGFTESGSIVSIAVMGAFILSETRKKNK